MVYIIEMLRNLGSEKFLKRIHELPLYYRTKHLVRFQPKLILRPWP